jgi:phosphoribosyl-AMP cyclohydrolase
MGEHSEEEPVSMDPVALLDFSKSGGLVTAIAQDALSDEILMVAHMNEESFRLTVETGEAVYWSRSRGKLWHKGEESGNVQRIDSLYIDCDGDVVLMKVQQVGDAACHTGKRSCFFRRVEADSVVDVGVQVFDPEKVYKK